MREKGNRHTRIGKNLPQNFMCMQSYPSFEGKHNEKNVSFDVFIRHV